LPLIEHPQTVHQYLLGAEKVLLLRFMNDGFGNEVKVTVLPSDHVEDRFLGQQMLNFFECSWLDKPRSDEQIREWPCRPFTFGLKVVELFTRKEAGPNELGPKRIALFPWARGPTANDTALIEGKENGSLFAVDDERSGLALLPDKLKNIGDTEVPKITMECD
jgi:hypothetical protein